jgi:hypothetical protein
MICHAPRGFRGGTECAENLIEEVALARTNSPAKIPSDDARRSANPPDHPSQVLVQHVRAFGIELNDTAWAALKDDQRLALALQEFFESGAQTEAS